MSTVNFDGIWKRYGTVEAVKNVDLTCPQGEMLALLGPSGCGKSSILKMVAGVEEVSEGEITFDGKPVSHLAPGVRNIAMVFEDYALYPHLTAEANIAFPLKVRGIPARAARERVEEVINLLALEEVRTQKVSGLSGGAQQRISIGRALVRDPELILFDEPLSHLDGDQKVQLRSEIKRLQQTAHLTSILVTHDQSEAIAMADRVAVMNDGELQQVGTPQDLYHTPANLLVANFIGEPPMNLLSMNLHQSGHGAQFIMDGLTLSFSNDPRMAGFVSCFDAASVIVGIRPEDIQVSFGQLEGSQKGSVSEIFTGRVDYVEPRGDSDVLTIVSDGNVVVVVETDGPTAFSRDDRLNLTVAPESLYFFSSTTQCALGRIS